MSQSSMRGWVEEILISPHATELPYAVERTRAITGIGLEADRYFAGVGTWSNYPVSTGKDPTLIEAEVLEAVGLSGQAARRNLVTPTRKRRPTKSFRRMS